MTDGPLPRRSASQSGKCIHFPLTPQAGRLVNFHKRPPNDSRADCPNWTVLCLDICDRSTSIFHPPRRRAYPIRRRHHSASPPPASDPATPPTTHACPTPNFPPNPLTMSGRAGGGGGGRKVLLPPINFIFKLLQQHSTVQIWLYEQLGIRIEGKIRGFDEFMNLVIDDAVEVKQPTKAEPEPVDARRELGMSCNFFFSNYIFFLVDFGLVWVVEIWGGDLAFFCCGDWKKGVRLG